MADSLRDQLIAAGYKAPKKEEKRKAAGNKNKQRQDGAKKGKKTGSKPGNNKHGSKATGKKTNSRPGNTQHKNKGGADTSPADAAAIEERKKLKAKIKVQIDDNKLDEWKGEVPYTYLVEKRIRELYVKDTIQQQLAERTLAITRLNGDTYVIPRATALSIREINPQWSVFNLEAESLAASDESEEYADFKVPDDLKW